MSIAVGVLAAAIALDPLGYRGEQLDRHVDPACHRARPHAEDPLPDFEFGDIRARPP